jgi:pimeloyl-ACP methyl ester carboxylesterase
MESFGQDVASVVKVLDLKRVVLVGHSMGGPAIVEAAKQLPDRVVGLVGVDAFQNLDLHRSPDEIDALLEPVRADYRGAVSYIVRSTMFVPASDAGLVEQITALMAAAPPEMGIDAVRSLFEWKGENALEALSIPKFTINADYQSTDEEAAARYGLHIKMMTGVGHFVMLEDAHTFNRLLTEVLSEIDEALHLNKSVHCALPVDASRSSS